ncbi:MAG: beta-galactosidase [Phycisphaerales bacterium]|nr:beta-galactosidase [Phycisphaerales bacterium]
MQLTVHLKMTLESSGIFLALLLTPLLAAGAAGQQRGNAVPEIPITRGSEADRGDAVSPGFVGIKEGHLWHDGKRLRLWGINAVSELDRDTFTKADQDQVLDRMKAVGFNAIRPHLYDIYMIPKGDAGVGISTYTKGDDSYLDGLDYFFAGAAKRGLLLYMTFDRRRVAITPEACDLVPGGTPEEAAEWKKTVAELNAENPHPSAWIEQVWPLDDRMERIFTLWVKNQLSHVNQYTGKSYAEDPNIAMWEISNETSYMAVALDGTSAAYRGYFGKQTQKRWNRFLKDYYKTDARLKAAWGSLEDGESLEQGTIKLSPVPIPAYDQLAYEQGKYPTRRVRDLTTFFVNQYIEANNRILAVIRDSAPKGVGANVVPVGYDTHYQPSLLDMYCAGAGDVSIAGNYTWLRTYDTSDPTYPWTSMVAGPPQFYGMDLGRITGKPTVSYEVNIHKPAPYRAEFPFVVAAYDSARNWDGTFWYYWMDWNNKPPKTYEQLNITGLHYAAKSNVWGGVAIAPDPIQVSALKVAGEIFKTAAIRADEHPARIVVGEDELVWSPAKMTVWMDLVRTAMRTTGAEIDFNFKQTPRDPQTFNQTRTQPRASRLGPDVKFDHAKRQMVVDNDKVKMFVGWPDSSAVSFADGFALNDLKTGQFIAFAMVAEDGLPLGRSKKILLTALATGENKGFKYDPASTNEIGWPGMMASVVSMGEGPVEVLWPKLTVVVKDRTGHCTWFNALPEVIGTEPVDGQIQFDGVRPAAWGEVELD